MKKRRCLQGIYWLFLLFHYYLMAAINQQMLMVNIYQDPPFT